MKARLVAGAVAIGLIVLAFVIRASDGGDDEPGDTSAPVAQTEVICITELAAVCADIPGARIEAASVTLTRIGSRDGRIPEAWITYAPLAELADELRDAAGGDGSLGSGEPIGSTALAAVVRASRRDALVAHCGGELTWTCIGDAAGRAWTDMGGQATWGQFKPGHDRVERGGRAAVELAAGVSAAVGGDGWGRAELDAGPGSTWLRRVERAQPNLSAGTASALEQLLVLPATYDLVLTTGDQVEVLVVGDRLSDFSIAYPSPMRSVEVVVAGSDAGAVVEQLGSPVELGTVPADSSPLAVDGGSLGALIDVASDL